MRLSSGAKGVTFAIVAPVLARVFLLTAMKKVVPEELNDEESAGWRRLVTTLRGGPLL